MVFFRLQIQRNQREYSELTWKRRYLLVYLCIYLIISFTISLFIISLFFFRFLQALHNTEFCLPFSKSLLSAVDLSILKYARHTYIHRLDMTSFDQREKINITFSPIIELLCPCFVSSLAFLGQSYSERYF